MITLLALLLATSLPSTRLPGPISGDFDHDGKADTATIVREGRDVYFLRITRGAAPSAPVRLRLGLNPPDLMVPAKNSGSVATACGKGVGAKSDPCPHTSVQVTRGDLLLGSSEASQSVLLWNGQTFRQEWLAD
jgi:hypothetical protein